MLYYCYETYIYLNILKCLKCILSKGDNNKRFYRGDGFVRDECKL